jgi:hypothetical protein
MEDLVMDKIGIIGAGNMGSGIVQKTAQEGLSVVMLDLKPEFVEKGLKNIRTTLEEAVERKLLRPEQIDHILARIKGTTDLADTKDCDLIIEAVMNSVNLKRSLPPTPLLFLWKKWLRLQVEPTVLWGFIFSTTRQKTDCWRSFRDPSPLLKPLLPAGSLLSSPEKRTFW